MQVGHNDILAIKSLSSGSRTEPELICFFFFKTRLFAEIFERLQFFFQRMFREDEFFGIKTQFIGIPNKVVLNLAIQLRRSTENPQIFSRRSAH